MNEARARFPIAAMLTSLPLAFEEAVREAAALGFTHVDVVAEADRADADLQALAATDLVVSCAAVGRGLPPGHGLDVPSADIRRASLEQMKLQVADAARLGATACYIVPGTDPSPAALVRFGEACRLLADFAARRKVRLCVEHVPGRALPHAAGVLSWLEQQEHENLMILIDLGHCLLSREQPAQVVAQAGHRLGYVHLDDNDGNRDLHLPLLEGSLTTAGVEGFLQALRSAAYSGTLSLELNQAGPNPAHALRDGKSLLERLMP